MDKRKSQLLTVSNVLNNTKVFHKIAEALDLSINVDDQFFYDIEEAILDNFRRMNKERRDDSERITLDELGARLGIEVVHMDGKPSKPSEVKEIMTPFGYTVKVGGLNGRVGVPRNKKQK